MLAAFVEWMLWLAAFLYCLVKVYQKADNWSIKVLAVVMMISFTLLRYAEARFVNPERELTSLQRDLSPRYGRYAPSTDAGDTILPRSNSLVPPVVCFLGVRDSSHSTMALLHL